MSARKGPAEALARAARLRRSVPLSLFLLSLCSQAASLASSAAGLAPGGLPWALPLGLALLAAGILSRLAIGPVAVFRATARASSLLVDDLEPRRCLEAVEGCLPLLGLGRRRLGPDGISLAFSAGASLAILGEEEGARAWLSWLSARADEPKQAVWRAEARASAAALASEMGDASARDGQLSALRGVLDGPRPPKGAAARRLRAFLETSERAAALEAAGDWEGLAAFRDGRRDESASRLARVGNERRKALALEAAGRPAEALPSWRYVAANAGSLPWAAEAARRAAEGAQRDARGVRP
ncbi:hypothetical protein [Gordonibacter sp. An230]|uniref:hypothetical protein n=1 Tax=Gordonibacter sp. An230 TaxID=1965592 RepID=UPI000B39E71A|nr:hypothetical protein [Gordonibacter sp. An230]